VPAESFTTVLESIFVVLLKTVVVVPAAVVRVEVPVTVSLVNTCALATNDEANKNKKSSFFIKQKGLDIRRLFLETYVRQVRQQINTARKKQQSNGIWYQVGKFKLFEKPAFCCWAVV
jgi:hypothetical protein